MLTLLFSPATPVTLWLGIMLKESFCLMFWMCVVYAIVNRSDERSYKYNLDYGCDDDCVLEVSAFLLVSVIVMVGDPCVGLVPGIIYLYIELFADKITITGGTTTAMIRNTAAIVKTRFRCIKITLK